MKFKDWLNAEDYNGEPKKVFAFIRKLIILFLIVGGLLIIWYL